MTELLTQPITLGIIGVLLGLAIGYVLGLLTAL
jgi:ABC-type lipoprotein release transport system permease subunit